MNRTLLRRRWPELYALLLAAAMCLLYFASRPKFPNATGDIAAQIDVGMSYDDAVAVLREHEPGHGVYLYMKGRTHDGRELSGYSQSVFHNLPPAHDVAWIEFNVMDDYSGRELYITIEPRGVVTELRLESSSSWEELRYSLAYGTGWSGWRLFRKRSAG